MTVSPLVQATFSRADMRAALAAYLQTGIGGADPLIPYLGLLLEHAAKITPLGEIASPDPMAGEGIGAVCWIKLENSHNRRIALGKKLKTYRVALDLMLLSYTQEAQDAEAANDAMLDGIEAMILADRTAGTGATGTRTGVVWQWGEGEGAMGGTDIEIACGYPTLDRNQRVQLLSRVTVAATQEGTA